MNRARASIRAAVVAFSAIGASAPAQIQVAPAPHVRYDGHKAVRVTINTVREFNTAMALTDDVWSHREGIGGPIDMRMSPEQFAALQQTNLQVVVLDDNIQDDIDAERARLANNAPWQPGADGTFFDDFRTYDEHRAFLQNLANQYPNLAQMIVVGQSLEGRDIFGIRITGPGSVANRPAAFYNAAQHAREWATPPIIAWIADQLLTNYATDCRIKQLVDQVDFYLVPIVNPDGYVWTWGPDRMWRKNRRPPPVGSTCVGVDTNRNWGYQWGGEGSSPDPCSETYRGTAGFSEPETQAVRSYIMANSRFKVSMDFHSYGELIMSPWAYTSALPPEHPTFNSLNLAMQEAIFDSFGRLYDPGPVYTTIYPAAGGAVDWFYGQEGIYGFTIEVRAGSPNGFVLPPAEIVPDSIENYNAILALSGFAGDPLLFDLPNGAPATVAPNTPTPIQVTIASGNGAYYAGSAKIHSRIGTSGAFTATPMTPLGGASFQGTLPGAPCGSTIQYYFTADTLTLTSVTYPPCGESDPLETQATTTTVVLADAFESPVPGWAVQNDPSLTSGAWVRADPVGTTNAGAAAQPEDDYTPAPGVNCYVTQNGTPGGQAGAADVDGGPTRLTSPVLNLAGQPGAIVSYAYWHYSVNGSPDPFIVEVSNSNGATWVQARSHNGQTGWRTDSFNVQDFVPLTGQVLVRFTSRDNPNDSLTESAVDEFKVSVQGCPQACYPDCNNSGSLTIADFSCFQTAFAAGQPYADCNTSGTLTIADFACFQAAFAQGCP